MTDLNLSYKQNLLSTTSLFQPPSRSFVEEWVLGAQDNGLKYSASTGFWFTSAFNRPLVLFPYFLLYQYTGFRHDVRQTWCSTLLFLFAVRQRRCRITEVSTDEKLVTVRGPVETSMALKVGQDFAAPSGCSAGIHRAVLVELARFDAVTFFLWIQTVSYLITSVFYYYRASTITFALPRVLSFFWFCSSIV